MNDKLKTEATDSLFNAILQLKTTEECYAFFEDLCTVNELLSMTQRFEVATMLKSNQTYLFHLASPFAPSLVLHSGEKEGAFSPSCFTGGPEMPW